MVRFPKLLLISKEQESSMAKEANFMFMEKMKKKLNAQAERFKKSQEKLMNKKVTRKPNKKSIITAPVNVPPVTPTTFSTPAARTPRSPSESEMLKRLRAGDDTYISPLAKKGKRSRAELEDILWSAEKRLRGSPSSSTSSPGNSSRRSSPGNRISTPPTGVKIPDKKGRALLATKLFTQKMIAQPKHKKKGSRAK